MLYKRTEGTLRTTHEIGSFLNKITAIKKDYIKDMRNLIASYANKKMLVNEHLDFTVRKSVETLITTIEETIQFEATFTANLTELSTEIENFVKDKTVRRQKLKADGETMTKELQNQYETLKRSKAFYASQAKDAEKQQAALVKASSDASVKTNKLAQMSTKTSIAIDKARTAENDYKDVVRQTNERQTAVYTREMPSLLKEFQTFEEERIAFVNEKMCKYADYVLSWPKVYEDAGKKCREAAEAVSAQLDISAYVQGNRTGHSAPRDIPVEIIPGPHNNNSTGDSGNTSGGGSSGSSQSGGGGNNGGLPVGGVDVNMVSSCEDLLKEKVDLDSKSSIEMYIQRIDSAVRTDEGTIASLEKMAAAYGNDPARKKMEAERDRIARCISAARAKREDLIVKLETIKSAAAAAAEVKSSAGGGMEGGSGSESGSVGESGSEGSSSSSSSSRDNPEVMVKVQGIYDYEATCDTELSFKEGQVFIVTEQDSSGWWYATADGKQGFVPANYVKVLE